MSKQAQFAMLAHVENSRESAARILRQDILPAMGRAGRDAAEIDAHNVRMQEDYGLYSVRREIDDLVLLGSMLQWFLASSLVRPPQVVTDQIAELGARVFDHAQVLAYKAGESGRKARGVPKPSRKKPITKALEILVAEGLTDPQICKFLDDVDRVSSRARDGFPIEICEPFTPVADDSLLSFYPTGGDADNPTEVTWGYLRKLLSRVRSH